MDGDIRELALRFDRAIERRDSAAVLSAFHEDCTITLPGIELTGREGAERWVAWLFSELREICFEPVIVMTRDDTLFEEFIVRARTAGGRTLESRQAEVLVFQDGKVKSLRLYFDRLDVAQALSPGFFSRMAISHIGKQFSRGLG